MSEQVPLVDYLVLGDSPHLRAHECTSCGARYFDRRNACAKCFATEFEDVAIGTEGVVNAFTIVAFAAPGIPGAACATIVNARTSPSGTTSTSRNSVAKHEAQALRRSK